MATRAGFIVHLLQWDSQLREEEEEDEEQELSTVVTQCVCVCVSVREQLSYL